MRRPLSAPIVLLIAAALPPAASAALPPGSGMWGMLGRDPTRSSSAPVGPGSLALASWTRTTTLAGAPIEVSTAAGVLTDGTRVYALARIDGQHRVLALNAVDGSIQWAAPAQAPLWDSTSTPALDADHGTLLVAAGASLTAYATRDGSVRWQTALSAGVVNASPLVTDDRGVADRAFICDDGGSGGPAYLYCINVDPWDAVLNPYAPGQIVWQAPLDNPSGSTPAYADGMVLVAIATSAYSNGQVLAFSAGATSTPQPLWTFTLDNFQTFFGGVSLKRESGGGLSALAATYNFGGGPTSSTLVKLDAGDGSLLWSAPCNRTDSMPIALPDGRIALSGGLAGFGTLPTLQMFQDNGSSATLLWDTASATWTDLNSDGVMDVGEYLLVGGWSHQPALALGTAPKMLIGSIPTASGANAYGTLSMLDLSRAPGQPGFVVSGFAGAGNSPALSGRFVFTSGPGIIAGFGPRVDVNADGRLTPDDLHAWHAGQGQRDVDGDGFVTPADAGVLLEELRKGEGRSLLGGRP